MLKATGTCWCGCGTTTENFFAAGHDKRAESMLLKLLYGPENTVAAFLNDHGYGNDNNLSEASAEAGGGRARRKMKGPNDFDKLSTKEGLLVSELIQEIEEHFEGGHSDPYELNWFQDGRAQERVWREVVREAQAAGWMAELHAAIVRVERP